MTKARVAVFDLGGVFLGFDYRIAARNIAAASNVSAEDVSHFINHSPLIHDFECGRIQKDKFFEQVRELTGFTGTIDEFGELFCGIFTPIEPMIRLQQQLRGRAVPTYIFSNTNEVTVQYIRRNYPFFSNFDGYVFSYEHGLMKPDPQLYEVVEQITRSRGAEIFYTDDLPQNVAAGAARGWQALLHESPQKTRIALEAAGLL